MPALRFKTCRRLSGNVRNRELTIIQGRILRRLRNKKRYMRKKIVKRKNRNSYIQSQTTRKLPLFYGDKRRTRFIFLISLRFLFVATFTSIFSLFSFSLDFFTFLMQKVGLSLGVLTFTSFLMKVGFPKSLTSFISEILRAIAIITDESEPCQIMMVGPSGRPPLDLNFPAPEEESIDLNVPASEEGRENNMNMLLVNLEEIREQKVELAQRIRPLIEEESLKQKLQEPPSETAMVENLITRMASSRTRAANGDNPKVNDLRYLKAWLTRACQNAEDKTKGRMDIRTEIKILLIKMKEREEES